MALTRKIRISNRIFTTDSLEDLLKLVTGFYKPNASEAYSNSYTLQIDEDENSSVTLDGPPKDFRSLLSSPITKVNLAFRSSKPIRRIELNLRELTIEGYNDITIHGDNEDWANLTHAKISKQIETIDTHPSWIRSLALSGIVILPLAVILGWPLLQLLTVIQIDPASLPKTPTAVSASLIIKVLSASAIVGFLPAFLTLIYVRESFPYLEIRTGHQKHWKYHKRQKLIKILGVILIVAPSADLIYDLYKMIYSL